MHKHNKIVGSIGQGKAETLSPVPSHVTPATTDRGDTAGAMA